MRFVKPGRFLKGQKVRQSSVRIILPSGNLQTIRICASGFCLLVFTMKSVAQENRRRDFESFPPAVFGRSITGNQKIGVESESDDCAPLPLTVVIGGRAE